MRLLIAIVFALGCTATAQYTRGWINLFEPPFEQCPTIMMAISCLAEDKCLVPGGDNGSGFDVYDFSGAIDGTFKPMNMPSMELMIMAISVGGTVEQPHGACGGVGFGNGVEYLYNKTTFEPSLGPIFLATQDIRNTDSGMEILVVDNGQANTVLYSSDAGAIFQSLTINTKMPSNFTMPRYGAIPTSSIYYVTLGSWPKNHKKHHNNQVESAQQHELSERVTLQYERSNKKFKRVSRNMAEQLGHPIPEDVVGEYSAVIAKTSDGGKTWTNLVSLATNFYFNAIDCAPGSTTHCIAVGEGFNEDAAAHIYLTTDGTTFKEVLQLPSNATGAFSLMVVKFNGANSVWAAGSFQTQSGSSGIFYESTDGGNTWVPHGAIQYVGEVTSVSFVNGTGFATGVTVFDDSTILRYDSTGPTPSPAPTWLGNFTQTQCNNAECTKNCTSYSFPQNTCLPLNGGGSAVAQCQPGILMQTVYPLSANCQGLSQMQPQPLDQCLQAQSGYFENFCGPAPTHAPKSLDGNHFLIANGK